MKPILLISYFFPPCNLTAAQRTAAWARQLQEFGYYPIVLTRNWDIPIKNMKDVAKPTISTVKVVQQEGYEVHYFPHIPNQRDRLFVNGKKGWLRKLLTLKELLLQPISDKSIPFYNLYQGALEICGQRNDLAGVIISGNPFISFKLGHQLNKQFKLPWIADYRDAWTTSTINAIEQKSIMRLLNRYERLFERKWVGSAQIATASSPPIGNSIEQLTKTPTTTLYNGFNPADFKQAIEVKKKDRFTITYVGTLYEGQPIETFITAFKTFCDQKGASSPLLRFPGLKLKPKQHNRITELLKGYENNFETSDRIPRDQVLKLEQESHLLLHVAWNQHKGIIASKIYEYLGSGTRILVCPGDNSSIDAIIKDTNAGNITNSVEDTVAFLEAQYQLFSAGKTPQNDVNSPEILAYSRFEQTKKLASLLDKITNTSIHGI